LRQLTVRCTVDNCAYWAQDNYCAADSILITSDAAGRRYPEGVDAPQTNMIVQDIGETPVSNCSETACKTFRRR
jgi:hypothetical protein